MWGGGLLDLPTTAAEVALTAARPTAQILLMNQSKVVASPSAEGPLTIDVAHLRERLHHSARNEQVAGAARYAAAFVRRALESYAGATTPTLLLSAAAGGHGRLDRPAATLAEFIGEAAASLPTTQALAFLTGLYPILLPDTRRRSFGAYYTPDALVASLFDMLDASGLRWRTARVLDPAAGGAVFLLHALDRMLPHLEGVEPAIALAQIAARLRGVELDPLAAALAQAALEIRLAQVILASKQPAPRLVELGDTLALRPEPTYDLTVCNPPFGRVGLTDEQRQTFGRSVFGHANLYALFFDQALRWSRPGAHLAFVTPTGFLGGQYFSSLRRTLIENTDKTILTFVDDRRGVFDGVLQEAVLSVHRTRSAETAPDTRATWSVQADAADGAPSRIGALTVGRDGEPWVAARTPADEITVAASGALTSRLADWGYRVATGPLVWNRHKDQLRARAEAGVRPLVWADTITTGSFIYDAKNSRRPRHFAPALEGQEWLVRRSGCVLLQRTTAKEQSRRLIAAELPDAFCAEHAGAVVENHLNMLIDDGAPKVSRAALCATLNSQVADTLFRSISGSVAVSAYELTALPLPEAGLMATVERLVASGAQAVRIEAELGRLYGLTT